MKENINEQKIQNPNKKNKLIKEWKNFLIRQEFLKIYLDTLGFKESLTVRHLVDITNFHKQHENEKLQFAIIKINLKTSYIQKEKKLFKKNYRNKNQNISKNKKLDLIKINEYNNNKKALIEKNNIKILKTNDNYDSSINFLELIFTGILNLQNTKLYKEDSIIDKFIKRFNSEYKKLDLNEKLKFEKNDEIFKNDEIKKYHEKLIDDLYGNELNKNLFNSYEENDVKDNYSLFFGVNGMLVEYISGIDILRIIEKDSVTEENIGEKIYKHILEVNKIEKKQSIIYRPVYEDNMILFSDNIEKEQILSINNNYLEFFILLLSTVLFLINFMIYQPEKFFYFNKENIKSIYDDTTLNDILTKEMLQSYTINNIQKIIIQQEQITNFNSYNGMIINYEYEKGKKHYKYFGLKFNKKKDVKNYILFDPKIIKIFKPESYIEIPIANISNSLIDSLNKQKIDNNIINKIIVTLLIYNEKNNMNLIEKITFSFDKLGKLNYYKEYTAYKVFLNKDNIYITLVVINIFFLLTLTYDTYRIITMIINRIIDYIKYKIFSFEYGDLVDLITYIFVLTSSIWFYVKFLWNQKKFHNIMSDKEELNYWIDLGFNLKSYQKFTSIALLLLFFKLIRFIYQFLPALDIIFSTFADAFKELFSLFILIVVVLIGMFMMFESTLGFYSNSYYNFNNSFSSTYMLFAGIFDFDSDFKYINELNSVGIYVWFIFFLIFNLILCNVFLCLIRNAFQEIKDKKQMFNDALFMITKENFIDFCNKIKNLVLCKEPEDVMKEEEEKKQNKLLKENNIEIDKEKLKKEKKEEKKNDDVEIMKKMVNKSWTKIFKYNLSNLNIKNFFRKNVLTLEEFEKKKMNNYNILRKQIIKKYIEELKLNASENFDFLIDSFLYIIYLLLTVLMICYQLKLNYLEEVNYIVQNEIIKKYNNLNQDNSNIYSMDCDNIDYKVKIPFYIFDGYLRTTTRLYIDKPNSNVYLFETNKCKVDFENINNIDSENANYLYISNISTLDGCGGYFEYFFFNETNNNCEEYNNYTEIMLESNPGLMTLDFYIFSEFYDYIIYIRNILYIYFDAKYINENEVYLIPFNRFTSYNDFIRIVIEIIYYIFTLYFIYRIVYKIFSLIFEKMYNNYLNDSNKIYFENSSFINKYYRIGIQSYKNESGFLLLFEMIFITLFTFIKQTLLLIYFIILSILEFILNDIFNFFDFFSMILTIYLFCLWFIIINKTNDILVKEDELTSIFNKHDNNLIKVNKLYLLYKNYISVSACNLFLIIIRIIRYLKFSKRIYLVFAIFENEKLTIALYLVFLTVIDLGFVFFGYALFDQNILNFSTIGSGILNIIIMLMGKFHPNTIFNFQEENNMRAFYIFIFISFNFLVLLNFFYSILIEGYSEVKNFQQKNSSNSRISNDLINIYKICSVKKDIFLEVCERYKKKIDFYLELFEEQIIRYREVIDNVKKEKKEKNEKNENDENDNNCLTNIRLTNKIYENFYNNVKKISDYCEDINNFTEIELLNDEKKEENKNLIDEENEEEEEKKEKKYSYLNSLQKKYKNKIMDKVSIYHKIIIYISYLLNYNMNFVEKEEEEKKKRKQKELYSVFIEDDEQMFENIESNKWDSLFYPEYKHIIRSLNTKSVLREFLFDKYFYYVFRINTNFEKFLTNYSNPKDKPNYLTDNRFNVERVPRYSKLTFSETIIGIEKSDLFMIPSCLSRINKRIYNTIPFEFNDTNINRELINDIFTKFAGIKIYDIFIKYFYLPNSNNTIDNEIYLGYYLYQIYKKNNQKRTMNLSKEIPKYEIEKFYKKIEYLMNNNILIKNNENFISNEEEIDINNLYKSYEKEFNLYYKYYIWNILYIIIFQTNQNIIRKIKSKSESYKIINEYKQKNIKNESLFYYLFTQINKLHEKDENIENDEVLKEKNLPNGYSFTEALISLIRDENLISQQNFNIDNFDKADLLYFDNKKYLLENDEKLEEMLLKPSINYYDNKLKYETYPSIFLKLWKNRDLDELFALFYGYNKKINDNGLNNLFLLENNKKKQNENIINKGNQENKNIIKEENSDLLTKKLINELNEYNFLEKNNNQLDIYDFFDSENRAEIMLMLEPNSNSLFVKDCFEKLLKKSVDNKAEFSNAEKNYKFSELLNHFDIFKINYIKKHDLFNDVFEIHFAQIKKQLLLINNSFNILFRKFFKENNHLLQINDRILINKYIKLIAEKERFIFLYNYFNHKTVIDIQNLTLKNKIDVTTDDNEDQNKENIYDDINIVNNRENNFNNNSNLIKNIKMLIKENPFLWILSLDPYDYLDTCQKIRSNSVREFYLELYEFIYGEDETKDEEYYLKKKIKLNFVEKYIKYLEYVKLRDDIEKCQNIIDIRKKELDENLKYYNERKEEYNRLFNNWNEQKKILNDEINKQEKKLKKD